MPLQKESHLQTDFGVEYSTEESIVSNRPGKIETIFIHFHFFKMSYLKYLAIVTGREIDGKMDNQMFPLLCEQLVNHHIVDSHICHFLNVLLIFPLEENP